MNNIPQYHKIRRNKKYQKKQFALRKLLLIAIFVQISINTIGSITQLVSTNIQYFELTKHMQDIALIDNHNFD